LVQLLLLLMLMLMMVVMVMVKLVGWRGVSAVVLLLVVPLV
jgi:hypothetical protein